MLRRYSRCSHASYQRGRVSRWYSCYDVTLDAVTLVIREVVLAGGTNVTTLLSMQLH